MAKKQDPISELNEWQEHQYNPGYWINRPPFFPPKRTKGWWILSLIDVFLVVPAFFIIAGIYFFVEQNKLFLVPLVILGLFSILLLRRALIFKPYKPGTPHQAEIEEINRKNKKERKKKQPKRRKDYQ